MFPPPIPAGMAEPIAVDVLADLPTKLAVARLEYPAGTAYEISLCAGYTTLAEFHKVYDLVPDGALPVGVYRTEILCCGHGDEITFRNWSAN